MSLIGFSGGPAARGVTRKFEGDLSSVLGFTPTGVSYFDQREYEAIIRKGEPGRSYYSARGAMPLEFIVAWDTTQVRVVGLDTGRPVAWGDAFSRAASGTSSADAWPSDSTAVDAKGGIGLVAVSLNNSTADARAGVLVLDFIADRAERYSDVAGDGGRARSLDLDAGDLDDSLPALVNGTSNAVAISGPDYSYPLDEYRRPAFHIAVATDGGVSVILPDADNRGKRVTDSASTTAADFATWRDGALYWAGDADEQIFRAALSAIEAGDSYGSAWLTSATTPALANNATALEGGDALVKGSASGVELLAPLDVNKAGSLRALQSSTALSGWMPGDCKLALDLNAYGAGSVAASTPLDDDFTGYADQAAAEAAGWETTSPAFSAANDGWDLTGGGNVYIPASDAGLTVGETYVVEASFSGRTTGGVALKFPSTSLVNAIAESTAASGVLRATITVTDGVDTIGVGIGSAGATDALFDSITIRRAYPDLSPANNGAIINGTLTAAAVETGADVIALSGWSASNYLEVPYSSDFDMGTGAFELPIAFKRSANSAIEVLFERDSATTAARFTAQLNANGTLTWTVDDDTTARAATTTRVYDDDQWHICLFGYDGAGGVYIREGGVNVASATGAALLTLNNASAVFRIGLGVGGSNPWGGSIALPRCTKGYFVTPEQARKIDRDERKLFEPNAKCFLPSDTVNSLDARDGLLLIGTEGGAVIHDGFIRTELLDSGDIGLTENGVDSAALLGGTDLALVTGSEGVARIASRNLAEAEVVDAFRYERDFSGKGYTTNATPLDIAKLPLAEGEYIEWRGTITARSDDGSERGSYSRVMRAYRDVNGNVTVAGTDTLGTDDETTAGMDVSFAADTTAQTVDLNVTGVASTNMQWTFNGVLTINRQ
jgi:hypothetical protein